MLPPPHWPLPPYEGTAPVYVGQYEQWDLYQMGAIAGTVSPAWRGWDMLLSVATSLTLQNHGDADMRACYYAAMGQPVPLSPPRSYKEVCELKLEGWD